MRRQLWIATLIAVLIAGGRGLRAESPCCEPSGDGFVKRLGPAGGWNRYGGGLLHWWNPCCFPCGGAPDDYCRKPLPRVCWPPYPSYYIWGAPAIGCPQSQTRPDCNQPH